MIEINLLEKKKALKAPIILGVDTAKLPWRGIIVSLLISVYAVEYYAEYTKGIEKEKNEEVEALKKEVSKVKKEVRKNKGIQEQLKAFNSQIDKLKQRSAQVDQIIALKTNPRQLMELLAKQTPPDLWFDELSIDDQNKIEIKGGSESYQSIGEFLLRANESPFFGKSLLLKDSKTEQVEVGGVSFRQENFIIEGEVKIFDPYITGR